MSLLNQWAQRFELLDLTVLFLSGSGLAKAGLLLMLFWGAWFHVSPAQKSVQIHTVATMVGCFIAMVIARAMVLLMPVRARPLHEDSIDFRLPIGVDPAIMDGWSAFPSDHATLFYGLAAGAFYVGRWAGISAMIYVTLIVALPRIYLGYHYASDIVAGLIIGGGCVWLANQRRSLQYVASPMWRYSCRRPEIFYPVLFLVTYQVADLFQGARDFARYLEAAATLFLRG